MGLIYDLHLLKAEFNTKNSTLLVFKLIHLLKRVQPDPDSRVAQRRRFFFSQKSYSIHLLTPFGEQRFWKVKAVFFFLSEIDRFGRNKAAGFFPSLIVNFVKKKFD